METDLLNTPHSPFGDLLPIREAYEWKLSCARNDDSHEPVLLPIREAYEWKHSHRVSMTPISVRFNLLPIREAYEWKQGKFMVFC